MAVYSYKRGPNSTKSPVYGQRRAASAGPKHDDPELRFQIMVVEALKWALPDDILFTANAAGVRVTMNVAIKMKRAGVRRGWPDLQFLCPDGLTRYLELKAPERAGQDSNLLPDQKLFRNACQRTGLDLWARAKSLDEVEAALLRWGIKLKVKLSTANRYDQSVAEP